jgi:hypothetical protein
LQQHIRSLEDEVLEADRLYQLCLVELEQQQHLLDKLLRNHHKYSNAIDTIESALNQ